MSAELAILSELYIRTAGSYESPTWTEAAEVEELTATPTWDTQEVKSRNLGRGKYYAPTLIDLEISGSYRKVVGDVGYETLMGAMVSGQPLDILCLDGDIETEGTRGWRADMCVTTTPQNQGVDQVLKIDFTLKPYPSHPIQAVEVTTTGGETYTTPGS